MRITNRQWLAALLVALALHALLLGGAWLIGSRQPTPSSHSPKGVMVSLDNFNAGAPPPASIQDMPIENVQQNKTVANAPPAAAQQPTPESQAATTDAGPQEAPTVGPEPEAAAPVAAPSAPAPASSPAPSEASQSTQPAGTNSAAIVNALTIHPQNTLADIRPQNQVTAQNASGLPDEATSDLDNSHNGAYGNSDDATTNYINALRAWLARHKQYPQAARRQKVQGTVKLYLVIGRDGQVLDHRIQQSSGSAILDRAARDMLAHSEPLPAMPGAAQRNRLELIIPIVFTLH